jgi:hypothetical protein
LTDGFFRRHLKGIIYTYELARVYERPLSHVLGLEIFARGFICGNLSINFGYGISPGGCCGGCLPYCHGKRYTPSSDTSETVFCLFRHLIGLRINNAMTQRKKRRLLPKRFSLESPNLVLVPEVEGQAALVPCG